MTFFSLFLKLIYYMGMDTYENLMSFSFQWNLFLQLNFTKVVMWYVDRIFLTQNTDIIIELVVHFQHMVLDRVM